MIKYIRYTLKVKIYQKKKNIKDKYSLKKS